jgi:hypothetical protein
VSKADSEGNDPPMDFGFAGKIGSPQMQVRPQINANGLASEQVERIGRSQIDVEARIIVIGLPTNQKVGGGREPRLELILLPGGLKVGSRHQRMGGHRIIGVAFQL